MELATVEQLNATGATGAQATKWQNTALAFARREPVTPWILNDTARHYQWYPFVNVGHAELAKRLPRPVEKPSLTFINRVSKRFGNGPARMRFTGACRLPGAATT